MNLSVREVLDLSERCFRAAGFDPSTARAHAAAVWWAEAYRGTGLAALEDLLGPLDDADATTPTIDERESPISVLDGRGLPCPVSAVPALDLACAHADRYGNGITRVTECVVGSGEELLGALACRAAERGYVSLVLSVGGDAGSRTVLGAPAGARPAVAEATPSAPSEGYAAIDRAVRADRHRARQAPLFRVAFDGETGPDPYDATDARLLHRFLQRSVAPAPDADAGPGFVVACIDPRHPRYSGEVGRVAEDAVRDAELFDRIHSPEAVGDRVDRLVREGVAVDRKRWRELFEFGNGVLAPPFEGSEKGAGFDLNELEG